MHSAVGILALLGWEDVKNLLLIGDLSPTNRDAIHQGFDFSKGQWVAFQN